MKVLDLSRNLVTDVKRTHIYCIHVCTCTSYCYRNHKLKFKITKFSFIFTPYSLHQSTCTLLYLKFKKISTEYISTILPIFHIFLSLFVPFSSLFWPFTNRFYLLCSVALSPFIVHIQSVTFLILFLLKSLDHMQAKEMPLLYQRDYIFMLITTVSVNKCFKQERVFA